MYKNGPVVSVLLCIFPSSCCTFASAYGVRTILFSITHPLTTMTNGQAGRAGLASQSRPLCVTEYCANGNGSLNCMSSLSSTTSFGSDHPFFGFSVPFWRRPDLIECCRHFRPSPQVRSPTPWAGVRLKETGLWHCDLPWGRGHTFHSLLHRLNNQVFHRSSRLPPQ